MPKARPITPDQGWSWIVLVAAFFCNLTFDGIIFSFGIFYLEFLDYFNESRGRTSWIGSVISGVYAIVGPLASVLANKYGCRAVTICGALIASLGFILSTFSPNIWVMMLTYGGMGGLGFGLMYLCAYVMIGYFFDKYRALATGFTSCGSGVGTFIFAPLSQALIDNYGWKGGMLLIAGFVLNGVVMGAVFRPIPRPQTEDGKKEELIDWKLLANPVFMVFCSSSFLCLLAKKCCSRHRLRKKFVKWRFVTTPFFIVFTASSFLCMMGFFVPFIYLPDFARKVELSKQQGAFLLSIIGITNTLGRIGCGWLSDKSWADPLKLYSSSLIIGGVATMAASWLTTYWMLCIYAAVFGMCVAAYVSLCAIILVEFLGLEKLSNSFGFLNMFRGIATFIGAPLAGFLFDITGQYDLAFYVAGAFIATSGVICLPLRIFRRCDGGATADAIQQYEKEQAMREIDIKFDENNILMKASSEFSTPKASSLSNVASMQSRSRSNMASGSKKSIASASNMAAMESQDEQTTGSLNNLDMYTRGIMGGEMGLAAFSASMENLRQQLDHGLLPTSSLADSKNAVGSVGNLPTVAEVGTVEAVEKLPEIPDVACKSKESEETEEDECKTRLLEEKECVSNV